MGCLPQHHRLCPALPPRSIRGQQCQQKLSCGWTTQDAPYDPAWLETSTMRQCREREREIIYLRYLEAGMCHLFRSFNGNLWKKKFLFGFKCKFTEAWTAWSFPSSVYFFLLLPFLWRTLVCIRTWWQLLRCTVFLCSVYLSTVTEKLSTYMCWKGRRSNQTLLGKSPCYLPPMFYSAN